jgi:hypothetical protein
MKKHITRLLFAALLLLALCIGASAAGTSGKCGPSAYWSFDSSTGTLTISGSGAMEDYEYGNEFPWMDYRNSIQTIVIGDQITQIGRNAFPWTACSTIQFGKSVRSIGAEAFSGCRNLNGDLTLPDSVQIVGNDAFSECTGLTGKLTLGNGLQTIGFNAFYDCPFSGDLVIPDSVTMIGIQAFYCRPYYLPETQGTLTLGKNLRTIGAFAFRESRYTGSLTLPDSVVELGERAFCNCGNLNGTLTLGKNLRTIGKEAFSGCAFTGSLTIPEGITEIADGTFSSLYQSSGMFTGKLTLPSTLKTIGASAFSYTDFSGELLIPDGVTSIGANAFKECDGFGGTLSLPDSVKTVGESAFYLCEGFTGLKLSAGLTKIERYSFAHMYGLKTKFVIPEGVTEIGESAFSCSYMPSVRFPSTLKKIGKEAFYNCFRYLDNCTITFSDGLEVIGDEAFGFCYFKKAIVLPASIKSIGKKAFDGYRYSGKRNDIPIGAYFLGAAPQIVGTGNANCSFPSDWTLFYLPGTSGWTGDTYAGYKIALWDGETRWDNLRTSKFGYGWDNKGNEIETSWSVNTDTGKITLTDDLNEGCAVAVSYDADGRVTSIGVLRTKTDFVVLNLQDTCRLFLLNASSAPRLNTPVTINDYLPT